MKVVCTLVLDAEIANRAKLEEILSESGHFVVAAERLVQGIELGRRHDFDVIFCNTNTAGVESVLEFLMCFPSAQGVVMCEGGNVSRLAPLAGAISAGVADFLITPISRHQVKHVLDSLLAHGSEGADSFDSE